MKLSTLLRMLQESNFQLDGETDYERVKQFMKDNNAKPVNAHVWKLINALQDQAEEAEDDL